MNEVKRGLTLLVLLVAMMAGWVGVVFAQAPTTTVQDTVYNASGAPASGTVLVSWNAFTTAGGTSVPAGTTTGAIGANGLLSLTLVPNVGATPMGSYYTAVFHLSDGTTSREYWVVPAVVPGGAPATLAAIRNQVLPTSVAMQTVSKQYVDSAIAAAVTGTPEESSPYVLKAGDTMTGPLNLPADPVNTNQAADKHYVDTSVAAVGSGPISVTRLPLFGASGASHAAGIVPDPGATAGSTRYLREDGTWVVPPGGSGGSGTVTSVAAGVWPSWLTPTVTSATTTPSIAVAASAIPNAALANSAVTVNGQSCVLGSTCTIAAGSGTVTSVAVGTWPSWLTPTVTSATIAPSIAVAASAIPNAALANSAVTVNGQSCVLGSTCTIAAGSGTVTSVTAGSLSPLFSASVATGTTTPAISFTASTAAQGAFLAGPASGGSGAYSFRSIVAADVPTLNQSTTGNAATATALAATPTQATSGQYCTGVTASGNCNSAQVTFAQLSGTATATQLPAATTSAQGAVVLPTGASSNTLGTMASQAASAVAVTGGTINGTTIGATTPAAGTFSYATVKGSTVGSEVMDIENTNATGVSAFSFLNNSGTSMGGFGYANTSFTAYPFLDGNTYMFGSGAGVCLATYLSSGKCGLSFASGSNNAVFAGTVTAAQVVGGGSTPAIAAGAAAGTSPTVSVSGTNMAGVITLTTGTATTASATLATVTFNGTLGTAPQGCQLEPRNANAAAASVSTYTTAPSTTAWSVAVDATALAASTAYSWAYLCM
jgi:hypothetical protein